MSQRDRDLLHAAGLKAEAAAEILRCSRQAIYQGLSRPRPYFKTTDALVMLNDFKRRDSPRADNLRDCLKLNFTPEELDLILPERVGLSQLSCAIGKAQEITIVYGGDTSQLFGQSSLIDLLDDLAEQKSGQVIKIVGEHDWIQGFFKDKFGSRLPFEFVLHDDPLPIFYTSVALATSKHGDQNIRAFILTNSGFEEMNSRDARQSWLHGRPELMRIERKRSPVMAPAL